MPKSDTIPTLRKDRKGTMPRTSGLNEFDPMAASFFLRAGITDPTQQNAVNNLVLSLRSANLISSFVALYPFVGGTASSHSHNLISASFQITWNGGITHDSNGVRGNGTTGYGDTGLTPSTGGLLLNSTHLASYINQAETVLGAQIGNTNGGADTQSIQMAINLGPGTAFWDCYGTGTGRVTGTAGATTGFYVGSRSASNATALYRNASAVLSGSGASETINSMGALFICGRNQSGALGIPSDARLALVSIGLGFSAANVTSYNSFVQTFESALSRS